MSSGKVRPLCRVCKTLQQQEGGFLVCKRGHKTPHPTRRGKRGGRQQRMRAAARRHYREERDANL